MAEFACRCLSEPLGSSAEPKIDVETKTCPRSDPSHGLRGHVGGQRRDMSFMARKLAPPAVAHRAPDGALVEAAFEELLTCLALLRHA